ncbi:hypothetical protein PIB30_047965 [Stylosanthes scabra]|uniref:DUF2921 domain-containing protein n=1 Tax=Stylosanthes scabra TaxID=79078 RepID=A0ABU6QHF2_9FABA|nr:hypothetical protein [Stylosanthes scabra]
MSIGISDGSYGAFPTSSYLPFIIRPGLSFLKISFEGVYLQSNDHENGKEHLLCLLGNRTLPISKPFIDDWNDHYLEYSLLQDDQILLVLRYPQSFNLTSRAVRGEMRSLNKEGSLAYFDNVHISSQLNVYSMYQFSSGLKSRSCDLHPYEQDMTVYGSKSFKSSFDFCHSLRGVSRRPFDILQNHKDRHDASSKLGPFQLGKESDSSWSNGNYRLVFQDLICDEEINSNNLQSARVSAVLRAFPASMDALTEQARTGLSGMTLSVEGRWDSSTKKLCMMGCVGVVDSESEVCNSLISLNFPNVFSIEQRSLMKGSISSISNETNMFFLPLFFDAQWSPMDLKSLMSLKDIPYYNYSKVDLAAAMKKKNQPSKSSSLSKKPFFKLNGYPNKLDIHTAAIRHESSNNNNTKVYMEMEVLSHGASYSYHHEETTEILNISLQLTLYDANFDEIADPYYPCFLEGVYDPLAGNMYLIGCRKVSHGLDCLVEVKVQYPSELSKDPSVVITITSQRSQQDKLHFKPFTLKTLLNPN